MSFTLVGLRGQSRHFWEVCAKSLTRSEVEGFKGHRGDETLGEGFNEQLVALCH